MGRMYSIEETEKLIKAGQKMLIAGDSDALAKLPKGDWIGGSIPYFMGNDGGLFTKQLIYADILPDFIESVQFKYYNLKNIKEIYNDAPDNGISFIIIPGFSEIHSYYSIHAPEFDNFAMKPIIGWISGFDLADTNKASPSITSGMDLAQHTDKAVVMHVQLPAGKAVEIGIVNIFKQGNGDTITFPESGFSVKNAFINGVERNFAEYLMEVGADIKLPLVADYSGAMINTSFQTINESESTVNLYAPVFSGFEYKLAANVGDYINEFKDHSPSDSEVDTIAFSCNCILNYMYCNLENKKTGKITGPITFGEIAYQLLNQTMVYAKIISV